jgi:hypothetical protein
MKKLIAILIVSCLTGVNFIYGQMEKGKFLAGLSTRSNLSIFNTTGSAPDIMSLNFTTVKYKSDSDEDMGDDTKLTGLNMAPRFGYFISDHFVLGIDFNLAFMKMKSDGEYDYVDKTTLYAAGPFMRYYIPTGKVFTFLEAGAVFGSQIEKSDSGDGDDSVYKTGIQSYGGGAGIAIPIGEKVTFDSMLCYTSTSFKDKQDNPDNARYVLGNFGIKLGFNIIL